MARKPSAIGNPVRGITGPATGFVVAVVDEVAAIVLVVEEIGTLSTSPDPPPQETMRKVPAQTKEKGELKIFIDPLIMQFSHQAVDGCQTCDENGRTCPHREHQIEAVRSTCAQ